MSISNSGISSSWKKVKSGDQDKRSGAAIGHLYTVNAFHYHEAHKAMWTVWVSWLYFLSEGGALSETHARTQTYFRTQSLLFSIACSADPKLPRMHWGCTEAPVPPLPMLMDTEKRSESVAHLRSVHLLLRQVSGKNDIQTQLKITYERWGEMLAHYTGF